MNVRVWDRLPGFSVSEPTWREVVLVASTPFEEKRLAEGLIKWCDFEGIRAISLATWNSVLVDAREIERVKAWLVSYPQDLCEDRPA